MRLRVVLLEVDDYRRREFRTHLQLDWPTATSTLHSACKSRPPRPNERRYHQDTTGFVPCALAASVGTTSCQWQPGANSKPACKLTCVFLFVSALKIFQVAIQQLRKATTCSRFSCISPDGSPIPLHFIRSLDPEWQLPLEFPLLLMLNNGSEKKGRPTKSSTTHEKLSALA